MPSQSSHYDVGIVRQFPFSSALQRASVIVKPFQSGPKDLIIFLKGAPETVAKLCQPESVPEDFFDVLKVSCIKFTRPVTSLVKRVRPEVIFKLY